MGLFLMLSGVANCSVADVQDALREFGQLHPGHFELPKDEDSSLEDGYLVVAESPQGNVTVVYPPDFELWDKASQFLSNELSAPVFSLHIHDGDLWMYKFFVAGEKLDQFVPVPRYWEEIPEEEVAAWAGHGEILAAHWPGVTSTLLEPYLVFWEDLEAPLEDEEEEDEDEEEESLGKAYPDDEFEYGDEWQLVDFMKRLNLVYPDQS